MTAKQSIDSPISRDVVEQMVQVLGRSRAAEVLDVTEDRMVALASGRGRLGELQLNRIAAMTRRTWQLWALDASEGRARTPRQLEVVVANRVMRDLYERFAPDEIARAETALAVPSGPRAARRRTGTRSAPRRSTKPAA